MIQNLRTLLLKNKIFIFAIGINFIYVSCTKDAQTLRIVNSFSGEQLFDGIVFGQGEVSKLVNNDYAVENLLSNKEEVQVFNEVKQDLYKKINEINPSYFSHFQEVMQGGNHEQIKAELKNVGNIIQKALKIDQKQIEAYSKVIDVRSIANNINKKEDTKLLLKKALYELNRIPDRIPYDDHSNLVVFVLIIAVAAIVVAVAVFCIPSQSNNSQLYLDTQVNTIAENLSLK